MDIQKTAGNFISTVGKLDPLIKAAKGLLCLPSLLKSFKTISPANLLKGLAGMAAGLAASIVGAIADAITDRIMQLLDIITMPLQLLQRYIKTLLDTITNIKKLFANIKQKAKDLLNFLKNTQDCSVQTANFLNCIATAVQKKITKKVLSKIKNPLSKLDNQFTKLQKDIQAEAFRAGGFLEQHVGRQVAAAEKLTRQLEVLTR